MGREPDYKECPKCGLRNKKSAGSCTFCGYVFDESIEPLSPYIEVLEKLSKIEKTESGKDDLAKKIEFTLIKKELEEEVSDSAGGKAVNEENFLSGQMEEALHEEHQELEAEKTTNEIADLVESTVTEETEPLMEEELVVEQELVPVPDIDTTPEDRAVPEQISTNAHAVETEAILTAVESEASPKEPDVMTDHSISVESATFSREITLDLTTMASTGAGVVLYLSALVMGISGVMSPTVGWIVGIAGALLIIFGVFRLYPSLFTGKGKALNGS